MDESDELHCWGAQTFKYDKDINGNDMDNSKIKDENAKLQIPNHMQHNVKCVTAANTFICALKING